MKKLTILFFACILVIGCKLDVDNKLFDMDGEKLTISKLSNEEMVYSNEIELQLEKGAIISVWNVMDVKFENNSELKYHIDIIDEEGNIEYYSFEAFKLSPVIRSGKEIMGDGDLSLKGKMGTIKVENGGTYKVKAYLTSRKSKEVKLRSAELVFKI